MKRTKYTYRFLYMLTTLLFLGSCQLGKHYTRPKLDLPETLDSMSVDTVSIGDYPWEQLYTDTTLQGLIRKTLSYNKDMLIAAARVKELAAMKRIDYANMFPQSVQRCMLRRKRRIMEAIIISPIMRLMPRLLFRGSLIYGAIFVGHAIRVLPNLWDLSKISVRFV